MTIITARVLAENGVPPLHSIGAEGRLRAHYDNRGDSGNGTSARGVVAEKTIERSPVSGSSIGPTAHHGVDH